MKLTDITEESTEAEVAQALTDNIVEKFENAGPSIDKMTDEEVKAELNRRGIDPGASFWKTRSEIYARNFEESQNVLKATNAALEEWKRLAGVYEQEARVLDSDLRDQMEITGRKEMELTKLRGEMRRMQQNIERLEGIISTAAV